MRRIEAPPQFPQHAFTMAEETRRDSQGIKMYRSHCTCHEWHSGWAYDRRSAQYQLRRHIESEDWKSELSNNGAGDAEDYRA